MVVVVKWLVFSCLVLMWMVFWCCCLCCSLLLFCDGGVGVVGVGLLVLGSGGGLVDLVVVFGVEVMVVGCFVLFCLEGVVYIGCGVWFSVISLGVFGDVGVLLFVCGILVLCVVLFML